MGTAAAGLHLFLALAWLGLAGCERVSSPDSPGGGGEAVRSYRNKSLGLSLTVPGTWILTSKIPPQAAAGLDDYQRATTLVMAFREQAVGYLPALRLSADEHDPASGQDYPALL